MYIISSVFFYYVVSWIPTCAGYLLSLVALPITISNCLMTLYSFPNFQQQPFLYSSLCLSDNEFSALFQQLDSNKKAHPQINNDF